MTLSSFIPILLACLFGLGLIMLIAGVVVLVAAKNKVAGWVTLGLGLAFTILMPVLSLVFLLAFNVRG